MADFAGSNAGGYYDPGMGNPACAHGAHGMGGPMGRGFSNLGTGSMNAAPPFIGSSNNGGQQRGSAASMLASTGAPPGLGDVPPCMGGFGNAGLGDMPRCGGGFGNNAPMLGSPGTPPGLGEPPSCMGGFGSSGSMPRMGEMLPNPACAGGYGGMPGGPCGQGPLHDMQGTGSLARHHASGRHGRQHMTMDDQYGAFDAPGFLGTNPDGRGRGGLGGYSDLGPPVGGPSMTAPPPGAWESVCGGGGDRGAAPCPKGMGKGCMQSHWRPDPGRPADRYIRPQHGLLGPWDAPAPGMSGGLDEVEQMNPRWGPSTSF